MNSIFRFAWMASLALALAGCARMLSDAVPPRVGIAGIEVKSLGLFEQKFDVGLRIDNPNDFELGIEALDFEIEANGRPFASGGSRTPARIPAASSAVLQVEAITQSKALLRQLKSLPPEVLKAGVPYRVKGRVKIDGLPNWMPFDHSGTMGGDEKAPRGKTI